MTTNSTVCPINRALISVSDKTGVAELARTLADEYGVEILSTGGTARALREAGINVTEVSDYTGAPEIMDGRVKTLHPKIHGGLLGRRGTDDAVMEEQGISPIDLLVVNLYPFEQTIARRDSDRVTAIENIDIGGPAMLRAGAKNHDHVTVLVNADDYALVLSDLAEHGGTREITRRKLATKAFAHTASYDGAITNYLKSLNPIESRSEKTSLPARYTPAYTKVCDLRYGENPHQSAALYADDRHTEASLVDAKVIQGKPLSYNNLADADAALSCVKSFDDAPTCVIVKHANPCGVATADSPTGAYQRAFATDPVSSFGGIIAFNREVEADTAEAIVSNQFAEVILAPAISEGALTTFARKKNLRVLITGYWQNPKCRIARAKQISGGLLLQDGDEELLDHGQLKTVTVAEPSDAQKKDLLFAWRVAKHVKSNAIVYAHEGATIGIGAGQMSRVDSARIASQKAADAGLPVAGSVMASDAFFPFRDGIDTAAKAGIAAVIQPGGSIRDEDVIKAANEAGMAMLFTGMRHFWH